MAIKHIYANGCSYTNDNSLRREFKGIPYPEIIASKIDATVDNAASPGSCNRRIIRTTIRDCLDLSEGTLALIQLTHISRTERPSRSALINDRDEYHHPVRAISDDPGYERFLKHAFDPIANLLDLSADVIMLRDFLRNRKIRYLIFNHESIIDQRLKPAVPKTRILSELSKDDCVLDLVNDWLLAHIPPGDIMYDVENWDGGHGGHFNKIGHEIAAETITKMLATRGLL